MDSRSSIIRLNRELNKTKNELEEMRKTIELLKACHRDNNGFHIFLGNSNKYLGKKICKYLNVPEGRSLVTKFEDGETRVKIKENIRRKHAYVFQSTCPPVDSNLMELLIMLDACKRSSDMKKIAVIPYFGYARQDKKSQSRDPITAKLVADMITLAGATRVILLEPHFPQIQGYFNIPVDNLQIGPKAAAYIRNNYSIKDLVIVSPDAGGVTSTKLT